jgi:twitching motility protein PilU
MAKSRELGMQTFDHALFELYDQNHISYEEALRNADSANELRLAIKLRSKRGEPAGASGTSLSMTSKEVKQEAEAKA